MFINNLTNSFVEVIGMAVLFNNEYWQHTTFEMIMILNDVSPTSS